MGALSVAAVLIPFMNLQVFSLELGCWGLMIIGKPPFQGFSRMIFRFTSPQLALIGLSLTGLLACSPPEPETSTSTEPPATETPEDTTDTTDATEAEDSATALAPGRYCYGLDDGVLGGVLRLTVDDQQQVTGDGLFSIQNPAEGYFTSYVQKFEGTLDQGEVDLTLTTWIEYDQQESSETWQVTPTAVVQDADTRLDAIDCAEASLGFQDEDGLEAADLLDAPTVINTETLQFEPGTSQAVVENGVVRAERNRYLIRAEGGQQMLLSITAVENNAVFDVITPSGLILTRESTEAELFLPHTGEYQILVGGTRGNAGYRLSVEIPPL